MARTYYTAVFERGDRPGQWLASIREIPACHTFGRGLAQTRLRIREALVLWEGARAKSVEIREVLPLPTAAMKVKEQWASLVGQMERLSKVRDEVVASMKAAAWSLRDIAEVFDLSHQRVGQVSSGARRGSRRSSRRSATASK